jgi:allantoinase
MPGVIDTHVHVNEPGRTEWEGFHTAGRAAAAGGVTTIVVMPLNCSPVATSVPALMTEAGAAAGTCLVDFGFWGGLVPGNTRHLAPMWEAGALGFKCFMVHSGIDEFPNVTDRDLAEAGPILASLRSVGGGQRDRRTVLLAHAEDPLTIDRARAPSHLADHPRSYAHYLASRPAESEDRAIAHIIDFCARFSLPTHVVHLSSAGAIESLRAARARGLPISVETCPHYLTLAAEDIPDGATQFKCAPPIRERANQDRLWKALCTSAKPAEEGIIDLIASDHSPCPPELKRLDTGDFAAAWGGISSLQLTLPLVWTHASRRGHSLADLSRWLSAAPARLAGIDAFKGRIAPGFDADLIVFDPDAEWTVRAAAIHHRHKLTPYDGAGLRGSVVATLVRGGPVFADPSRGGAALLARAGESGFHTARDAHGLAEEAIGQWVKRSRA